MGQIGRAEGTDVFLAWVQSERRTFEAESVVGNVKTHKEMKNQGYMASSIASQDDDYDIYSQDLAI